MEIGLIIGIVVLFVMGVMLGSILSEVRRTAERRRRRRLREQEREQTNDAEPTPKKAETMKRFVWVCICNGFAWVWCSYILAYLDKVQIAESLSQVAVTEIIGVVLAYAAKSAVENLSKNNCWPDKAGGEHAEE